MSKKPDIIEKAPNTIATTTENPRKRIRDPWEYNVAMTQLLRDAKDGFVADDNILSEIQRVPTRHDGPSRIDTASGVVEFPQLEVGVEERIKIDAMETMDEEEYCALLTRVINEMLQQTVKMLFGHMETITCASGTTVDAQGQALSHDLLLDALEKIDLSFDEEGVPQMPKLYIHPNSLPKLHEALGTPTPEQSKRQLDILAKKKVDWDAAQRTRRIS